MNPPVTKTSDSTVISTMAVMALPFSSGQESEAARVHRDAKPAVRAAAADVEPGTWTPENLDVRNPLLERSIYA